MTKTITDQLRKMCTTILPAIIVGWALSASTTAVSAAAQLPYDVPEEYGLSIGSDALVVPRGSSWGPTERTQDQFAGAVPGSMGLCASLDVAGYGQDTEVTSQRNCFWALIMVLWAYYRCEECGNGDDSRMGRLMCLGCIADRIEDDESVQACLGALEGDDSDGGGGSEDGDGGNGSGNDVPSG